MYFYFALGRAKTNTSAVIALAARVASVIAVILVLV
jgi:hypothetical protein